MDGGKKGRKDGRKGGRTDGRTEGRKDGIPEVPDPFDGIDGLEWIPGRKEERKMKEGK